MTSAAAAPMLSLATVKEHIQVLPGVTRFDDRLRRAVLLASAQAESFAGRTFARATTAERHRTADRARVGYDLHGDSWDGLAVSAEPQSVALGVWPPDPGEPVSVRYDPSGRFGEDAELPAGAWRLDPDRGRLLLRHPTRSHPDALLVSYTGGVAASGDPPTLDAGLPEAVRSACLLQVLFLWKRITPSAAGSADDGEDKRPAKFTVLGGLVPEAQALLVPYRRQRTGRR